MGWLSSILGAFSKPAPTAAGVVATAGDVRKGLAVLGAFPVADLEKAMDEHFANLADDAVVAEDVAGLLASVGVPYAGDVGMAIRLLVWIVGAGISPSGGEPAPVIPRLYGRTYRYD